MGGQWSDGGSMWGGPGGMDSKAPGGVSSGGMGMWDEAVKNQASLRGNNNMGMKNSRSSPSLRCGKPGGGTKWLRIMAIKFFLPFLFCRFI